MKIAGIDQSIDSSGKVIMDLDDDTLDIKSVDFYGYSSRLYRQHEEERVHIYALGTDYERMPMMTRMDRAFTLLSRDMEDVKYVAFEDYAYAKAKDQSSNSVFQIGEFCGGVRYYFYMMGKGIITYGVPQIKHFATGNGNAKKPAMCQAVKDVYPQFYYPFIDTLSPQYESPHSDLCDAFWICEILRNHIKHDILGPESLPPDILALMRFTSTKGKGKRGAKVRCLLDYDLAIRSNLMFDPVAAGQRKKAVRKKKVD